MKKSIVILLFFVTLGAKAQGNLQFNQVITKTAPLSGTTPSITLTVPTGKVWKIEYYTNNSNVFNFHINNIIINSYIGSNQSYDFRPIWLKAGDFIYYNLVDSGTIGATYFLSIIEFNITQ